MAYDYQHDLSCSFHSYMAATYDESVEESTAGYIRQPFEKVSGLSSDATAYERQDVLQQCFRAAGMTYDPWDQTPADYDVSSACADAKSAKLSFFVTYFYSLLATVFGTFLPLSLFIITLTFSNHRYFNIPNHDNNVITFPRYCFGYNLGQA